MRKLIVISGLPGTGKSTIAKLLGEKLKIPVFSVDPIESSILKSGIHRSFETGFAAYLVAETLAFEQLEMGMTVIIDAVSPVTEARKMWHNLAKKHKAKLFIIECVLEKDYHKKRISKRIRNMHGLPEVTWKDVIKQQKEYLAWTEKRLILNTSGSPKNNLGSVLKYINT